MGIHGIALTFGSFVLMGWTLPAPVETTLYTFAGSGDGQVSFAGLIADRDGALYGTTVSGGSGSNAGTVFKLTPPARGQTAWTETVLYSFCPASSCADGAGPRAGMIADGDGALYSTTDVGGSSGNGVVFKLTPPARGQTAWTETVLYSFCPASSCADGANPYAGLIADNQGTLYGTTANGGSSGNGVVFKLTPPGRGQTAWGETVLYSFKGNPDGAAPIAGLIADNQGALYGTTVSGGSGSNAGTVFKLTPPAHGQTAWTETVLYSFCSAANCADGFSPFAGLIADRDGALYGTTGYGGSGGGCIITNRGCGTVFKVSPPARGQSAWTETVLYSFCPLASCADGSDPFAGLIADRRGALYSTTNFGGSGSNGGYGDPYGGGTAFRLTPPSRGQSTWTETVLHSFCSLASCADGSNPYAGLIRDDDGALYSTTSSGGASTTLPCCYGTVFKLIP
jgi:uncharacterized repeat protein (TIGR03803 family)